MKSYVLAAVAFIVTFLKWVRRKVRVALHCCPWCGTKLDWIMTRMLVILRPGRVCPKGHYLEEYYFEGAVVVYENEGEVVITKEQKKPDLHVVKN